MAVEFVTIDHDTPYLLPPSIQDHLPEEHLARFVVEMVDLLDMKGILGVYAGRGKTPYHPAMLVTLLFYGYATGTFFSRKSGCRVSPREFRRVRPAPPGLGQWRQPVLCRGRPAVAAALHTAERHNAHK